MNYANYLEYNRYLIDKAIDICENVPYDDIFESDYFLENLLDTLDAIDKKILVVNEND